ncbi:VVA0879 family protein [Nocardiopsis aegyptia]|uniref:VVA0879 family protein n=1 Tax=Nocardiopsis aegyptia TaxID=220378 RepID=UPI00366B3552
MSTDTALRTITLDQFRAEARARFGPNANRWAYQCPACGDVAVLANVIYALSQQPVATALQHGLTADKVLAQQCIGCFAEAEDHGTTVVRMPSGREVHVFELAPAPTTTEENDVADRDLHEAMELTEGDLRNLAARLDTTPEALADTWPALATALLGRAATLADHLADDARADSEHPWSRPAARRHDQAAEWLRWLTDELTEETDTE